MFRVPVVRRLGDAAFRLAYRASIWPHVSNLARNSLRVLLYHRISDPSDAKFFGLKSNVSAKPSEFASQLDYIAKHYAVVGLDECLAWIYEGRKLPKRALLITFDDGYRDNLTFAHAELAARRLPWLLFAATSYIGDAEVFFWDWVAEAFRQSRLRSAQLPLLGFRSWTESSADPLADQWVDIAKRMTSAARKDCLEQLAKALLVPQLDAPPRGTHLSWEEIAELNRDGCAVGSHTASHCMMLNCLPGQAEQEIGASRLILEQKLGSPVRSFSFPYGGPGEYDPEYATLLNQSGIRIAFRSTGGINFPSEARMAPFSLRRRAICTRDTVERIAAWAAGASRVTDFQ